MAKIILQNQQICYILFLLSLIVLAGVMIVMRVKPTWFLLQAVVRLPAFFVYPANSTGTILLVMAVSALIFGERPGKRQWAGIICILAALLCLS